MDDDEKNRFSILELAVKNNAIEIKEIHDLLMGPPPTRNNGINGILKKLREDFDKAMEWAHNIWNVKRREECIGLPEIKKLEDRITILEKGGIEMGVAKLNLKGVYFMSALNVIGLIVVALIGKGVL